MRGWIGSPAASVVTRALLVGLVSWATFRYGLSGRLDVDQLAYAAPMLWIPLLAVGGAMAGAAWAAPFCLGIALWWGAPVAPIGLIVLAMGVEAARRAIGVRPSLAFAATWVAAGGLAAMIADGLSFDVHHAARASDFDEAVVLARVLLELAATLSIALLLLRGRTAALLALMLSVVALVALTAAQPTALIASNGGCVWYSHSLCPGYALHAHSLALCALAIAPWVRPALRVLRGRD